MTITANDIANEMANAGYKGGRSLVEGDKVVLRKTIDGTMAWAGVSSEGTWGVHASSTDEVVFPQQTAPEIARALAKARERL